MALDVKRITEDGRVYVDDGEGNYKLAGQIVIADDGALGVRPIEQDDGTVDQLRKPAPPNVSGLDQFK